MRMHALMVVVAMLALPASAEEIVLQDTGARGRWGMSAGIGSNVGLGGVALHAELRLGFQLTRRFGIFGIAGGGIGTGEVYGAQFDVGAVAEFTPVDWFYCGAGLVASYGTTTVTLRNGFERYHDPFEGSFRPALDLRLGFSTGASQPPFFSRGGFDVGIKALLMLHPKTTLENFTVSRPVAYGLQVTFTPMLMLGFNFR